MGKNLKNGDWMQGYQESPYAKFQTDEALKPANRCSGFGFSFNMGISLFGGTAPLVLTFLLKHYGVLSVPLYYVATCVIGFIAIRFTTENIEYQNVAYAD